MQKIIGVVTPPQPRQTPQAIGAALQTLTRADVRLTPEQAQRLASAAAPLARAGLLSPDEQIALAALLARQSRMRYCE